MSPYLVIILVGTLVFFFVFCLVGIIIHLLRDNNRKYLYYDSFLGLVLGSKDSESWQKKYGFLAYIFALGTVTAMLILLLVVVILLYYFFLR